MKAHLEAGKSLTRRGIRCPKCKHFLGYSYLPTELGINTAWFDMPCRSCQEWRRIDLGRGEIDNG